MTPPRVAITGLGIISPFGRDGIRFEVQGENGKVFARLHFFICGRGSATGSRCGMKFQISNEKLRRGEFFIFHLQFEI